MHHVTFPDALACVAFWAFSPPLSSSPPPPHPATANTAVAASAAKKRGVFIIEFPPPRASTRSLPADRGDHTHAWRDHTRAWRPSQISSAILSQKAGRSSGLRLVTRPLSTTTSSSTQLPPAFLISVRSVGHDVSLRPRTTSASTSVQGRWQITATGFFASKNDFTNATASSSPP